MLSFVLVTVFSTDPSEVNAPDVEQLPTVILYVTPGEPASDDARSMLRSNAPAAGFQVGEVSDWSSRRRAGIKKTPCLRYFDRYDRRVGRDLYGDDAKDWGRVQRWVCYPEGP